MPLLNNRVYVLHLSPLFIDGSIVIGVDLLDLFASDVSALRSDVFEPAVGISELGRSLVCVDRRSEASSSVGPNANAASHDPSFSRTDLSENKYDEPDVTDLSDFGSDAPLGSPSSQRCSLIPSPPSRPNN